MHVPMLLPCSDYMICDTLRTVLLDSCREVLEAVRFVPPPPMQLQSAGSSTVAAEFKGAYLYNEASWLLPCREASEKNQLQ
jgi:hypothetical protein